MVASSELEMVHLILADLDNFKEKSAVFENILCIYRFSMKTEAVMTQIVVGKITKPQICEQTGKVLFVIQFCPRKGAKLPMLLILLQRYFTSEHWC